MDVKKIVVLGVLLTVLLILVVLFFRSGAGEKIKQPSIVPPPEHGKSLGEEPKETRTIVLFFPSEEDSFLHGEERKISADSSIIPQAKQTIEELLKGSNSGFLSPFPQETELRELFLTKEGIAYVDFSKEIQEKHLSGSSAEMATVFSIVNSLTYNFKSIKKVFILIDGRERETLGGHINLTRAFLPQYDLVAE